MDKELGKKLLRVFDTPETVETIGAYAASEIDKANKGLQTVTDTVEIYRLQGVVRAMTVLKNVRDLAVRSLEEK